MPRPPSGRLQILTILLSSLLAACGTTQPTATATSPPPSATPMPTATVTPLPPTLTPTPLPTPKPTTPAPTATPVPLSAAYLAQAAEGFWWNDAVFYQIFVRSFYDSDGDGDGDLNGIIQKLDYLNDGDPATTDDLGVTGIWLMPIAESPSYHGYDVADYLTVESDYGTNENFGRLVDEAHQRGIQVIVDLVLNHTSVRHPWFRSAQTEKDSPYRDFYVWSEQDPGYKSPWGGRVWHRSGSAFFYGVFWEGMPDLNYENPDVTAEMQEVIRFWLEDMGADGFRLDGIKHLIEDGQIQENTPATHQWLRGFRTFYKERNPDALTVGEVWSPTDEVVGYVGDQLDLAFEFDTATAMLNSARSENRTHILSAHRLITERYPPNQFAAFLTNHDQNRVMSELSENVDRAKSAASLLLTGPGVPFIYYGEEIGQLGVKPDENIRTPMQWTDEKNAGFSTASLAWHGPQLNYAKVNIAAQTGDADSLLSHYRRLIHAREAHEALRIGDWREVDVENPAIYTFLRHSNQETLLVLINLSGEPISDYNLSLDEGPLSEGSASEVLTGVEVTAPSINATGGFDAYTPVAEMEVYSTYIIQLK